MLNDVHRRIIWRLRLLSAIGDCNVDDVWNDCSKPIQSRGGNETNNRIGQQLNDNLVIRQMLQLFFSDIKAAFQPN